VIAEVLIGASLRGATALQPGRVKAVLLDRMEQTIAHKSGFKYLRVEAM
jgi:hypothetical protein